MRQNFFEAIGAANIERIHSQMLGWLFFGDVLNPRQKSVLLGAFSGLQKEYVKFPLGYTEYQNIDLLVRADDDLFVIENKIKISQHDNQLERYKKIIDGNKDPLFEDIKKVYYIYLTLVPEDVVGDDWINKTYKNLLLGMQKFDQPSNADQYIFNEYVESIRRLVEVFEAFMGDHRKFPNVFQEGSLKKHEKLAKLKVYATGEQRYIALNQLETIFQKHFLAEVIKKMNIGLVSIIGETHGVATVQFKVKQVQGEKFNIGIQFQGDTVKLNFAAEDYQKSEVKDLPEMVTNIFEDIAGREAMRYNAPKSKAYVSVSEPLGEDVWRNGFETVVDIYKTKFKKCISIIEKSNLSDVI